MVQAKDAGGTGFAHGGKAVVTDEVVPGSKPGTVTIRAHEAGHGKSVVLEDVPADQELPQ